MTRWLLLAALAGPAWAAAPPVVSWQEAGDHVGEVVTVEGDVASARSESDTYVLEFAPPDARAFRAVLVIGLLMKAPPERRYVGRRVQVSGLVRSFAGRPEMVLRDPAQIRITGEEVPTAPAPAAAAPPPPAPAAAAAPPPAAAAAAPPAAAAAPPPDADVATPPPAPSAPPAPRGLVEAVEQRIARLQPCENARSRWRAAAAEAQDRAEVFSACAGGESYRCRDDASALARALAALDGVEREVEDRCP